MLLVFEHDKVEFKMSDLGVWFRDDHMSYSPVLRGKTPTNLEMGRSRRALNVGVFLQIGRFSGQLIFPNMPFGEDGTLMAEWKAYFLLGPGGTQELTQFWFINNRFW